MGEMKIVSTFQQEQHLPGSLVEGIDSIGVFGITFFKDYKLIKMNRLPYFIRIYQGEANQFKGNYFYKGKGPNDYLDLSPTHQQMDSLLIAYDFYQYKLFLIDLVEKESHIRAERVKEIECKGFWDPLKAFYLNDSMVLMKSVYIENKAYRLAYSFYNYKRNKILENYLPLYRECLRYSEMNWIYSGADALKPDQTKIVSVTGAFNQIDILDLHDPSRSFSISTSKENLTVEDLKSYANSNTEEELHEYYFPPKCNDQYIIALYQPKNSLQKEFHVISWEGKPLYHLPIEEPLNSFDVDWKNAVLYGLTEDGIIYAYKLSFLLHPA
jgi:hypothetical protein